MDKKYKQGIIGGKMGDYNKKSNYYQGQHTSYSGISQDETKTWINEGPNNTLLEKVEKIGKYVANEGLSTSQIRAIFTKLKEIDTKGIEGNEASFLMLKPLVAYASGRHNKEGLRKFKDNIINPGVDAVLSGEADIKMKFKNFVKLLEAVLAYHKAHGGKDK